MDEHKLYAGTALVEISPPAGVELGGYPHHPRNNKGIHDPLFGSVLLLNDGTATIVIVCLDILMLSKKLVAMCREDIEEKTGIPRSHIMICCSHSHSSPWGSERLEGEAIAAGISYDHAYVDMVLNKITLAVEEAAEHVFPGQLGVDKRYCGREDGVGGNRLHPLGIADPQVWVIGVKDLSGKLRACLAKYALHPTFLHSDNLLVSADYPGFIRSFLGSIQPEMVFLFAQGTSGNQSPRFFRSGKTFAEAERVGVAIGKKVEEILMEMDYTSEAALEVDSTAVQVRLRDFPPLAVAEKEAKKRYDHWKKLEKSGAAPEEVWAAELLFLGAENISGYCRAIENNVRIGILEDELPAEVQVLRIGDARIVALPGEVFVEFGITIQYRSPWPKTFVVELANGCLPGYACTSSVLAMGGYEAGSSMLSGRAGDQLVEAAVELLRNEGE